VHPGEVLTHGLSMVDVSSRCCRACPSIFRLIGPKDKINTYDLVEVADLGLVYTTTVGPGNGDVRRSGHCQRADALPRARLYP
jgi:hypothetical protein